MLTISHCLQLMNENSNNYSSLLKQTIEIYLLNWFFDIASQIIIFIFWHTQQLKIDLEMEMNKNKQQLTNKYAKDFEFRMN